MNIFVVFSRFAFRADAFSHMCVCVPNLPFPAKLSISVNCMCRCACLCVRLCVSVYVSVCVSLCVSVCVSMRVSVCVSVRLSAPLVLPLQRHLAGGSPRGGGSCWNSHTAIVSILRVGRRGGLFLLKQAYGDCVDLAGGSPRRPVLIETSILRLCRSYGWVAAAGCSY